MDREERLILRLIEAVERCAESLEELAALVGGHSAAPLDAPQSDLGEEK